MFFRRHRKQQESTLAESLGCGPHPYRAPVDPQAIRARVVREGKGPVQAGVVNLSLEGTNIEMPRHLDPGLEPGEVVSLELRHTGETWRIETPAQVEQDVPRGSANARYGLTFLNMGSLYAQMENTLGLYFNRRRHQRVRPEEHQDILVRLRQGGQKPRGTLHDLSLSGMCVALDLVAAASLQGERPIEFAFDLPDSRGILEGVAQAVSKRRLGRNEFLSLEFDIEDANLVRCAGTLAAYVDERARQMLAFSAGLQPR
jgi:c-di-GMP-binding flagellar brake protein YcgR